MYQQKQSTQELVELYCQEPRIRDGLLYVQEIDAFYMYHEYVNCYLPYKQLDFERDVYMHLASNSPKNLSGSMVKDFITQIKYRVYTIIENLNFDYIALKDGVILNTRTCELEPADKVKKCFHYMNCDPKYIEEFKDDLSISPRFKQFLDEVIVTKDLLPDPETQRVLQEMVGYYLLDTLEAHAVFFLIGKGRNGKSVLLDLVREMVGKDFYSAMNVETMTSDQFATSGLVGKKMNICAEDESSFVKTDKFKAIIAGDPITVRRMYNPHFTWKPTVKHLFATNEMPTFSGFNVALLERIKIIPFNRYFAEDERDTQLFNKLKAELSGIIAWAVAGAKRLVKNKFRFSSSDQLRSKSDEFKENLSPAVLFFHEMYVVEKGAFTINEDLYEAYKVWADSRGKKKQSYYSFIKDVETLTGLPDSMGKNQEGMSGNGKTVRTKYI